MRQIILAGLLLNLALKGQAQCSNGQVTPISYSYSTSGTPWYCGVQPSQDSSRAACQYSTTKQVAPGIQDGTVVAWNEGVISVILNGMFYGQDICKPANAADAFGTFTSTVQTCQNGRWMQSTTSVSTHFVANQSPSATDLGNEALGQPSGYLQSLGVNCFDPVANSELLGYTKVGSKRDGQTKRVLGPIRSKMIRANKLAEARNTSGGGGGGGSPPACVASVGCNNKAIELTVVRSAACNAVPQISILMGYAGAHNCHNGTFV